MKKVFIDTNIILRLLIGDVPDQLEESKKIFSEVENQESVGLISLLVVNELIWILENYYEKNRDNYLPEVSKLFSLKKLKIVEMKKKDLFSIFERMTKTSLDFTDIYLAWYGSQTKLPIASFDKQLLKYSF